VAVSSTTAASLNVTVVNSLASNNADSGIEVFSLHGAANRRHATQCRCQQHSIGLFAEGNTILRVAHSVVTGNGTIGVTTLVGGAIQSSVDNDIDGNTNNNTSVLTRSPCISALRAGGSPAFRPTRRARPCSRRLVPGRRPSCNATAPGMPLGYRS